MEVPRPGKMSGCTTCGIEGHMAVECPERMYLQSTWRKRWSFENNRMLKTKQNLVTNCGEVGHVRASCARRPGGLGQNPNKLCFTCGLSGHESAQCPNKPDSGIKLD